MGLPAGRRRPVRLWSGSCGLVRAWRGEGLAEASFLLRLLMAPSGHPNRIREASPELRIALLGEAAPGTCHQLGLSQPRGAFVPPWFPGLAPKPLCKSSSQRAGFGTSIQEGSLLNLLVGARASPERVEMPGARLWEQ